MRKHLPFLLGCGLLLALAGCDRSTGFLFTAETDDPGYRSGQQYEKQGRDQEALNAFLKVINARGNDNAPESHLEAGLLYLNHFKDPIAAIYHFRKYLAAMPNSPQAPLVRQQIGAAERDFARTLPGQPIDGQLQRLDLFATINRLQAENQQLKQQILDLQSGVVPRSAPAPVAGSAAPPAAAPAPASNPLLVTDNLDSLATRGPVVSPAPAATPAAAPSPAAPPAAAPSGRTHVVVKGDTLSSLSLRFYGTRAKWRDIYKANRDVMRSEGDLRIGTVLKIP